MKTRRLWTAALVGVLTLTGCHRETQHDAAPSAAAPTTTETTGPPRAAAGSLPDGFPSEIPVVPGHVDGKSMEVPGSGGGKVWNLTVTGVNPGSYDEAQRLLTDAGFKPVVSDEKWTRRPCDRESQYSNSARDGGGYVVHLCGRGTGPDSTLNYGVNVYPQTDWQIPQGPGPAQPSPPPGAPQPPGPPGLPPR